jgi:ribosome-associated protein
MEDMLPETDTLASKAHALGELLTEHKGQDVVILDLRGINNWTDFFVIATVSSKTHMDGLERHLKDHCHENNIDILGGTRRNTDDEWRLVDLGFAVIHLMNTRAREFYELERLWRPMKHPTGVDE